MRPHYRSLSETKQQYARLVQEARQWLEARLGDSRRGFACDACDDAGQSGPEQWLRPPHAGCGYAEWQRQSLHFIEQELGREILTRLQQVEAFRDTFNCHMCGMCCRLASSEHSYEALRVRAAEGDEFACQFSGIFLPYSSREAARAKYPDVVAAVLAEAEEADMGEERIFFYHCPYIGEDNRCTVYGTAKRPAICASYPETPLAFVYEKCAWRPWKDETHPETMRAHAMLALATDWADRLKHALGENSFTGPEV